MVDAKVRVFMGEPFRAQDSDLDVGSGVLVLGVTDLVSDSSSCLEWSSFFLSGPLKGKTRFTTCIQC